MKSNAELMAGLLSSILEARGNNSLDIGVPLLETRYAQFNSPGSTTQRICITESAL